jgi:hypothetical protein
MKVILQIIFLAKNPRVVAQAKRIKKFVKSQLVGLMLHPHKLGARVATLSGPSGCKFRETDICDLKSF